MQEVDAYFAGMKSTGQIAGYADLINDPVSIVIIYWCIRIDAGIFSAFRLVFCLRYF